MPDHTGEEVRTTREAQGLGQEDLALASGKSVRTIRTIEKGGHVKNETLRDVYRALGISTSLRRPTPDVEGFLQVASDRLGALPVESRHALMVRLMAVLFEETETAATRIAAAAREQVAAARAADQAAHTAPEADQGRKSG